jgi:hypothetical protein
VVDDSIGDNVLGAAEILDGDTKARDVSAKRRKDNRQNFILSEFMCAVLAIFFGGIS